MRTWIRQRFSDVIFWCSVVASIGTISCGYSTIRASQVKTEEQVGAVVQRLDKLESRLEKLVDMHVHDQQGAGARRSAPAATEGSTRAYRIINQQGASR